jgi:hypothetical protein
VIKSATSATVSVAGSGTALTVVKDGLFDGQRNIHARISIRIHMDIRPAERRTSHRIAREQAVCFALRKSSMNVQPPSPFRLENGGGVQKGMRFG